MKRKPSTYYIPLPYNFSDSDIEIARNHIDATNEIDGLIVLKGADAVRRVMRLMDNANKFMAKEAKTNKEEFVPDHYFLIDLERRHAMIYPPLDGEVVYDSSGLTGNPNVLALTALFNATKYNRSDIAA